MRPSGAVLLVLAGICAGCFHDGGSGSGSGTPTPPPTVTVLVENTDCAVSDIQISPFVVEQINSGGAISLRIKATVTCNGQPLENVKLTFTIPGGGTEVVNSNADGKVEIRPNSPGNQNRIGQTVGVAVTGADGAAYPKTPVTITPAP